MMHGGNLKLYGLLFGAFGNEAGKRSLVSTCPYVFVNV
jgi:hypothetical protein